MQVVRVVLPMGRICRRAAAIAVLCASAPALLAQQSSPAAPGSDPTLVISRTVNPRIAYRAVPTDVNPVHTQATLFPAREFHGAIDATLGLLLGDDALSQRGSAGVTVGAVAGYALDGGLRLPAAGTQGLLGTIATPIGPGASAVGGAGGAASAIHGATAGLGILVTGVAMPGVVPTQQGGGP